MVEVGFQIVSAFDGGIYQAGAIPAQHLEKGACVSAVPGACALVEGIKGPESSVRPEIRAFPEIHQAENAGLDAPHTGCGVAFEQMQFLEPLEYPEGKIDLDAMGVENLAVKFVRQSFANQQLVDFGAPARSRQVGVGISDRSSGSLAEPFQRSARPSERILHRKLKVFAGYKKCQADFCCSDTPLSKQLKS